MNTEKVDIDGQTRKIRGRVSSPSRQVHTIQYVRTMEAEAQKQKDRKQNKTLVAGRTARADGRGLSRLRRFGKEPKMGFHSSDVTSARSLALFFVPTYF